MRSLSAMTLGLLLLAACGDDDRSPKTTGSGSSSDAGRPGTPDGSTKKEARGSPDQKQAADRAAKRKEAAATVKQCQAALDEMTARHEKERADLPGRDEMRDLRRRFSQRRKDAILSAEKRARMEKRMAELKTEAEGAQSGELKELKKQRKPIEKRYAEATNSWDAARAEQAMGKVEASPVKVELDTCRALKQKWFDVTPDARRGNLSASVRGQINTRIREWLQGKPKRGEVATKILAQPLGPKKAPASYDFTNLDFYVLLELYENELDKLNIAVEKKEAKEKRAKLDVVERELDALDEKIAVAMQKRPGLEEYLDLKDRIKTVRKIDNHIQNMLQGELESVRQIRAVKDRQFKEETELNKALEAAKRALG